eukprot:CAMPEP_0194084382 /NCGR_PEP_ID=MMETSP0149-20130528/13057_1 /TAXON_ID=122233 /ORGANISM="Chaetoceros debilis, Strain MM31A-1" /LENGTH=36 /DNA_ID= /DNA_START= /DNA_END= /DNA_ORIENTATION=
MPRSMPFGRTINLIDRHLWNAPTSIDVTVDGRNKAS